MANFGQKVDTRESNSYTRPVLQPRKGLHDYDDMSAVVASPSTHAIRQLAGPRGPTSRSHRARADRPCIDQ